MEARGGWNSSALLCFEIKLLALVEFCLSTSPAFFAISPTVSLMEADFSRVCSIGGEFLSFDAILRRVLTRYAGVTRPNQSRG